MWKGFLTFLFVLMVALALSGVALGNTADVYQTGDYNEAYIEQAGDFNEAFITQDGDENEAIQTQIGTSNYVDTHQEGQGNKAFIEQHGNNNGSDTSAADGEPFEFTIGDEIYTGTFPVIDTFSYTQYQNGNYNTADAVILGNFNNTSQWQEGDDNIATIEITGHRNIAKQVQLQVQLSDRNVANITIVGDDNTAYQYQNGGHTSTISIQGCGIFVYIEGSGSYSSP